MVGASAVGSGASNIRKQSNQKQRSFSNDARIMLHESRKLEQRIANQNHSNIVNSLDSSMVMSQINNVTMPTKSLLENSAMGTGLFSSQNNSMNLGQQYSHQQQQQQLIRDDVNNEFEIYERKFSQIGQVNSA